MNKLGILDLEKVCRLCLSESENTHSIFTKVETEGIKLNILQLLSKIADIWLLDAEELPNKVCGKCVEFLIEIEKFLKSCLDSKKIIETYHEELKVQEFEVINIKQEVIKDEICEDTISEDNILEEGRINEAIEEDSSSDSSHFEDDSIDIKYENLGEDEETRKPSSDLNYYLQTLENGEKEFACNLCAACFKYSPDLKKHLFSHGEEPFVCSGCKKSHEHYQQLLMHLKYPKSNDIKITESESNKNGFTGLDSLDSYLKTQECGNDVYVCNKCSGHFFVDKEFNHFSYKAFLSHLMRHNISGETTPFEEMTSEMLKYNNYSYYCKTLKDRTKDYACNLCEERFISEHELKEHLPSHGDKPHWCSDCKKGFIQHHLLMIHVKNHNVKSRYQCDMCEKSYKKKSNLTIHRRLHNGERPYSCSLCQKAFKSKGDLNIHVESHSKELNHMCSQCSKKFKTRASLLKHVKRHLNINFIPRGEKSTIENIPKIKKRRSLKIISNYKAFAYYVKTLEDGKKIYACNLCDEQFRAAHELRKHFSSHGDKPYWCTECKRGFRAYSSLRHHLPRHDDKNEYLCPNCDKIFKTSWDLKTHLVSHSEEYKHKCNDCGKMYKRLKSLKQHLKTHIRNS